MLRKSEQTYRISLSAAKVIVFAPFVIVFFSLLFRSLPITRTFADWLFSENHPVELLTFASLFLAGILGWKLVRMTLNNGSEILVAVFYALFSAGLLFVAMEEVSWGQILFRFEPPAEFKAINRQGELNLHNMPAFHLFFEFLRIAFGLCGLFGVWLSSRRLTRDIGAPAILSSWFVLVIIFASLDFLNNFISPRLFIGAVGASIAEVLELLIGLSALLYMWLNGRMLSARGRLG